MPDDVALEKVQLAEMLGATVERVRPGQSQFGLPQIRFSGAVRTDWSLGDDPASIVDEKQFVVSPRPTSTFSSRISGRPLTPDPDLVLQNLARARAAEFTGETGEVYSHPAKNGQVDVLVSEKPGPSRARGL